MCKTDDISVAFSAGHTAPMIQVRWAETDLPSLETHPLYPGVKPTASITRGPDGQFHAARDLHYRDVSDDYSFRPTPTPTSGGSGGGSSGGDSGSGSGSDSHQGSPPDSGSSSGLSTGAKVGIGVGVGGGVLLIGAALALTLLFIYRRKRMNKGGPQMQQYNPQQYYQGPPPGHMQGPGGPQYPPAAVHANSGSPMPPSEMGQGNANQGQYEMASTVPATTTSPSAVGSELYAPTPPSAAAGFNMASSVPPASTASPGPQGSVSEMDSSGFRGGVATDEKRHELDGTDRPPRELATTSPSPSSPPVPTGAVAGPSFGSPETEPSAQEISQLQEQHAQLEARKKRLLELEQIEREQESLQQRMSTMGGGAPNQAPQ